MKQPHTSRVPHRRPGEARLPEPEPAMTHSIRHDEPAKRFTTVVDGHACELDYRDDGRTITITHTGVPPEVGGRGIAGELVRAAFDWARAAGRRVVPACSYAGQWARKHPEYADLIA
jgi:predicted GNAT family acetyltransferase